MALPDESITLNAKQINELKLKLSNLRHNVNNNLSLIVAAVEIIRRKPEAAERMETSLTEQPRKISDAIAEFSRELDAALRVNQP
jgi:predicted  nucleic acid-binding Zn-ribbon protein